MGLKIATDLQVVIKDLVRDTFYPVGSVYINNKNTNPGTVLGGTWARIPNGYLRNNGTATGLATGGGGTTGSTAITAAQLAAHGHSLGPNNNLYAYNWGGNNETAVIPTGQYGLGEGRYYMSTAALSNGSGQGHTHTMEPSFVNIYAWYRTA